jgi:hypothetical protein
MCDYTVTHATNNVGAGARWTRTFIKRAKHRCRACVPLLSPLSWCSGVNKQGHRRWELCIVSLKRFVSMSTAPWARASSFGLVNRKFLCTVIFITQLLRWSGTLTILLWQFWDNECCSLRCRGTENNAHSAGKLAWVNRKLDHDVGDKNVKRSIRPTSYANIVWLLYLDEHDDVSLSGGNSVFSPRGRDDRAVINCVEYWKHRQ